MTDNTGQAADGNITTVKELSAWAVDRLHDRFEAELLLMHALDVDRTWLFLHGGDAIDLEAAARFRTMIQRRLQGEPIAYITGHRGFWTLDLAVTPATFIPRVETEVLVEQALERLPAAGSHTVVDLGTGSGAVALAIASERPACRVIAVDASRDALAVARTNARRLHLDRVMFVEGDWLASLAGMRLDMVVSNPPYIEDDDEHLEQGDVRFEPAMALASGKDGLDAIRHIIHASRRHLNPGGWLLLEHGWQQGRAVRDLLTRAGYVEVATMRDLEQRDRVSLGRQPA